MLNIKIKYNPNNFMYNVKLFRDKEQLIESEFSDLEKAITRAIEEAAISDKECKVKFYGKITEKDKIESMSILKTTFNRIEMQE